MKTALYVTYLVLISYTSGCEFFISVFSSCEGSEGNSVTLAVDQL